MSSTAFVTCNICVDDIQPSQFIKCTECKFEACKECTIRFIKEKGIAPVCMACGQQMDRASIVKGQVRSFKKRFDKFQANRLFEKQSLLFAETQPYVKYYKMTDSFENEIKRLTYRIEVTKKFASMHAFSDAGKLSVESNIDQYLTDCHNYRQAEYVTTAVVKGKLSMKKADAFLNGESEFPRFSRTYIDCSPKEDDHKILNETTVQQCPSDECNGYITLPDYKCGLCEVVICKDCLMTLKPNCDHVCDEGDLESLKLISQETKPCPKCSSPVYKVDDGKCNDMFCHKCKTTFHWRTLEIDENGNSNEDYRAWLMGFTPELNIPQAYYDIELIMAAIKGCDEEWAKAYPLGMLTKFMISLRYRFRYMDENTFRNKTRAMRCGYLSGKFSKHVFKQKLMNLSRKNEAAKKAMIVNLGICMCINQVYRSVYREGGSSLHEMAQAIIDYQNIM